jgi:hypothetical protein
MKLAKIAIVLVLGSMENKFTFSTLAFMKNKNGQLLRAALGCKSPHVYTRNFYSRKFPLFEGNYKLKISKIVDWCYHLRPCVH